MVKAEDVPRRSIPQPASPPLPTSQPPPTPPLPSTTPSSVFSHDQIATIKRNLSFLQRATQQPPPTIPPTSPPHTPALPPNQPPPARHDSQSSEPAWTTFKNHFQVPYPPPGYTKNAPPAFPCPPPPLGHIEVKLPEHIPPPIRRPSAEPVDASASFEFALEAEKMVSELCSSSKDFSEKGSNIDTNRFEMCERRRPQEPWSMKPREVRTHGMDDYPQALHTAPNSHANVASKLEPGQLPCIYEDDLFLRNFIVKSCIEVGNALKGHERNSPFSDLVGFCRMVRDSAENPSAHEFHQDEVRSQILTFFRLASSWLSIRPLVERAGMQRDDFRTHMYRYFNDWQISTCRMMELIVKNMPSLKERLDSDLNTDALAYGDQLHRRQPFSAVNYDPQNSVDNLKRQRSVPNVQNNHRQWRPRRFSDHHYEENHNWHRNNPQHPRDGNNRNKWTIVSPDIYHHKPPNQPPFRKSDNYPDKVDNQNRYRPKMQSGECSPGRFSDHEKMSKWKYHYMYPSSEPEQDLAYKMQDDSLVENNHMVPLSQIENRCVQKHSEQQPVDLNALFQGYRVANENPKSPSDRQMYKGPPNQGQMRYGCKTNSQNRGRRWYNNYNFYPPPWVANVGYDKDDPHDGVYMKPGSYDVPKREQKPLSRQLPAPPLPPPTQNVVTTPAPRFKPAQTDEVTWQAALASAENFCKSLRSVENQGPQSDGQQQWMIQKSNSSETGGLVAQSHPEDATEAAAAVVDEEANKTAVKKSNIQRSSSMTAEESPPPPSSPPSTNPPPSTSPHSQPPSGSLRSLSPSASQKIRRFLETVWAMNEASHMKFSSEQENGGIDGQKVLEDTFQRLLDEGWAAGGAAAAAATAAAAAVSRRQAKQQ